MIKWIRAKNNYPHLLNEPVYVKTMKDEIRAMILVIEETRIAYSPGLFSCHNLPEVYMYWKDLHGNYTCDYYDVISWAYIKDNPGQEDCIRYKGPK